MMDLLTLYELADQENITVDCFDLDAREALSVMGADQEYYIAINPLRLGSTSDEAVKLAHEMGHCLTGSFYNQYAARDVRARHENHANKWAIKKLIPEDELEKAIALGYIEPWELAEYFNVTEPFMRLAMCWYANGNLDAAG